MDDTLEMFDHPRTRSVKTPYVTIQRDGALSLNWAAYEALGKPTAVKLGYYRHRQVIVFIPSEPGTPKSIPVRRQTNSDSYTIAGRAFTKWYDIDTTLARRYAASMQGGQLQVDLQGECIDATGTRLGQRKHAATTPETSAPTSHQAPAAEIASALPVLQAVEEAYQMLETVEPKAEAFGLSDVLQDLQRVVAQLKAQLDQDKAGVSARRAMPQ